MSEKIIRINNLEKYKNVKKKYGILMYSLPETAVINFDSNMGGAAISIKHGDYSILPTDMYEVREGRVYVYDYDAKGYVDAELMIWQK